MAYRQAGRPVSGLTRLLDGACKAIRKHHELARRLRVPGREQGRLARNRRRQPLGQRRRRTWRVPDQGAVQCAGRGDVRAQLNALSSAALKAFSTSQIASISTAAVAALSTAALNGMGSAQLGSLTQAQIQALNSSQFAGLSQSALSSLNLSYFGAKQVAGLGASAISSMSVSQFDAGVAPNIASLSTAAIKGLTTAQIQSLTAEQASTLTSAQLSAMNASQKATHTNTYSVMKDAQSLETSGSLSYQGMLQDAASGGMNASKSAGLQTLASDLTPPAPTASRPRPISSRFSTTWSRATRPTLPTMAAHRLQPSSATSRRRRAKPR